MDPSTESRLQQPFLRLLCQDFHRVALDITELVKINSPQQVEEKVTDLMKGLLHSTCCIFDGGSPLADLGLIDIIDEDGVPFDKHLLEICMCFWPGEET